MFAELVINIEAPLQNTFHYHVPTDLQKVLRVGHLVEAEFGSRMAQGIVIGLGEIAEVENTKPIIALVDTRPVLQPWQIELAKWMSGYYLAPLNACLRLMLPPGLTRWADIVVDLNPRWEGTGRLTDIQRHIIDLIEEKGDLRGRQIQRALGKLKPKPKGSWKSAVNQLVKRNILIRGTVLEPPRMRPKKIKTAELIAGRAQIAEKANQLGRGSKPADVLHYLMHSTDPLPELRVVRKVTGASTKHIAKLVKAGFVQVSEEEVVIVPAGTPPPQYETLFTHLPATKKEIGRLEIGDWETESLIANLQSQNLIQTIEQPSTISLAISHKEALGQIFKLRSATKYEAVLDILREEARPVAISLLYSETDITLNQLRNLVKLALIRFGSEEVWRDPLADRDFVPAQAPTLTTDQVRVWGRIKVSMIEREAIGRWPLAASPVAEAPSLATNHQLPATSYQRPILLHGVTGSGKTEIYMRAIEYAIEQGQQAIVLVPEIALTPQTVRRFAARFPGRVAVLHSRLRDGERYDTWRRAREGLFDIIVGPRSALFTPFPNLGVIVLDEEHDHSYKQTPPVPPPYYHTRETAVALGRILNATVIMGSATPDLVAYHQAQGGRFQLLELSKRVMGHRDRIESQAERLKIASRYTHDDEDPEESVTIPLPPVQIVDLRQELRAGNRSIFSRALQTAMDEVLERKEQAILFLNRRGSKTFIICRDCGFVLQCPRCDVPLTYHRPGALLSCHHCNRHEPPRQECPQCNSRRIKYFGLGTEQLETLVKQQWPQARTVRWDRDTTAGRNTHEQLLASFINQEADILVGTQMIAKGLDLPLVTLVGVISADVSLGLPDTNTGERAFQLLTQVSGRAGRGLLGGRVILQTYKPEHYAIQSAAEHDYTSFYLEEIRFRTQHSLPPFRRQAKLLLVDPVNDRAQRNAEQLANALRRHVREKSLGATEVWGPTPPFFNRIDGRYRWQIIIRSPDPTRLLADFPIPRPWVVDIDPVSML